MSAKALNQFGAVFTFAITTENELLEYYSNMSSDELSDESLSRRISGTNKRIKNLERSRRENVTEITLEPIEGLHAENYGLKTDDSSQNSIKHNHEVLSKFYSDAGPKLNVRESSRLFLKLAKEHNSLLTLE